MTQDQTTALAAFILVAARAAVEERLNPGRPQEWLDERVKAHAKFLEAFATDGEVK